MQLFTSPFFSDLALTGEFRAKLIFAAMEMQSPNRRVEESSVSVVLNLEPESPENWPSFVRTLDLSDEHDRALLQREATLLDIDSLNSCDEVIDFCDLLHGTEVKIRFTAETGDPFGAEIIELLPREAPAGEEQSNDVNAAAVS